MRMIKASRNVEFDVIYDDGTRKRVKEGVLFGIEDERVIVHNGTSRPEVLFAVAKTACAVIGHMNLSEDLQEKVADELLKAMRYGEKRENNA